MMQTSLALCLSNGKSYPKLIVRHSQKEMVFLEMDFFLMHLGTNSPLTTSPPNEGRSEKPRGRAQSCQLQQAAGFFKPSHGYLPHLARAVGEPPSTAAWSLELGTVRSRGRRPNRSAMEASWDKKVHILRVEMMCPL